MCCPQICHFGLRIILSQNHLQNNRYDKDTLTLKLEIKIPMWSVPPLYQEEETFLSTEMKSQGREKSAQTDLVKIHSYLPLVSPSILVTFPQWLLFVQTLRCSRFFGSSFSYGGSHVHRQTYVLFSCWSVLR